MKSVAAKNSSGLTEAEWIEMFGSPPAFPAHGDPPATFVPTPSTKRYGDVLGTFTRDPRGDRPVRPLFFPCAPQDFHLAGETKPNGRDGKPDLMTRILEANAKPLTVDPAGSRPRSWSMRRPSTYHPYERQFVAPEYADYTAILPHSGLQRPLQQSQSNGISKTEVQGSVDKAKPYRTKYSKINANERTHSHV